MSKPEMTPRATQALAAVISLSIILEAAIAIVLVNTMQPIITDTRTGLLLGFAFLASSIVAVFVAFRIRRMAASGATMQQKTQFLLVALAISESPSILGLVHALLTDSLPIAMVLCGIAGAAAILLFPRKEWLEN